MALQAPGLLALLLVSATITTTVTALGNNYGSYLSVSSIQEKHIELNWRTLCTHAIHWIGLFDQEPKSGNTMHPLVKINPADYPDGFYVTNVTINYDNLPGGWARTSNKAVKGPSCFGFWIGVYDENHVLLESSCLKIQPTWMQDNKERVSGIPVCKMVIPGTHDSGSYKPGIGTGTAATRDIIKDFTLTQETDVYTQLVFGIRYLDLRIGYYILGQRNTSTSSSTTFTNETLWINHDLIKIRPLRQVIQEIKDFIEKTEQEIIIIDLHRLPFGFNYPNSQPIEKHHKELIEFVLSELGEYAIGPDQLKSSLSKANLHLLNGPRMKDIWDHGKRLIISYPNEKIAKEYELLWPPLKQMWGDVHHGQDLKKYIQRVIDNPSVPTNPGNPLWAIMAELTPTAMDIILNPSVTLRSMADEVNRNITRWIEDDWWKNSNIYATDFFLGNNLIQLSIDTISRKTVLINDDDKLRISSNKC